MPQANLDTSNTLTVEFDKEDVAKYTALMQGLRLNFPRDAAWAANRTMRFANKEIKRAVTQRYATKQKYVNRASTQHRANWSNPTAVLAYAGEPMQLSDFSYTHPRAGVKGKQLKSSDRKLLGYEGMRAFVATFKSGHTAIVERKGKERLPLKTLYGSSVPTMVRTKVPEMAPSIVAKLDHYMEQRIEYQIKKAQGKI